MGLVHPQEILLMLLVGLPLTLLQLAGTVGGILYLVRLVRERQAAVRPETGSR